MRRPVWNRSRRHSHRRSNEVSITMHRNYTMITVEMIKRSSYPSVNRPSIQRKSLQRLKPTIDQSRMIMSCWCPHRHRSIEITITWFCLSDAGKRAKRKRNPRKEIVERVSRDWQRMLFSSSYFESRSSISNSTPSHRSKSKSSHSNRSTDPPSVPSSPENTVFCLRASDSSSSSHHRRRPHPLPRRSSTQTTPSDYVNKIANLFTKSFSTPSPSSPKPTNEHHISTQTYDTISSSSSSSTYPQSSISPPSKTPIRSLEQVSPRERSIDDHCRPSFVCSRPPDVFMIFPSPSNVRRNASPPHSSNIKNRPSAVRVRSSLCPPWYRRKMTMMMLGTKKHLIRKVMIT